MVGQAWEELCRLRLAHLGEIAGGTWGPAARWWRGQQPEWDVVSSSLDGDRLLLGEVKWASSPVTPRDLRQLARDLANRPAPQLSLAGAQQVRVLFVPEIEGEAPPLDVHVATASELIPRPGCGSLEYEPLTGSVAES